MTVQQLLSLCWTYEYISVETLNGIPMFNPEEATYVCELHPEVADLLVHTFYIDIRYVDCLHKDITVLVVHVK